MLTNTLPNDSNYSTALTYVKKIRPKPSVVFDTYWRFAAERQDIFFKKITGSTKPWTGDEILQKYKFTNAYRASDRVSQYLIKEVIYSGIYDEENTLFRTLLFKLFNKIETWELLHRQLGDITTSNFDVKKYNKILDDSINAGGKIYSAAYIMPSGPGKEYKGKRKHLFHLELLDSLIRNGFFTKLLKSKNMNEGFIQLLSIPSFGNFLAYQFITDLNYTPYLNFSEMEFVIPGPGARDGIKKCFTDLGEYSERDIIELVAEEQEKNFERLNLNFSNLYGRSLQLIDCQNLFCEVDKYSRIYHPTILGHSKRTKIKQMYTSKLKPINIFYPPKWNLSYDTNS